MSIHRCCAIIYRYGIGVISLEPGIYIFAGHFGSGKTEVALNFAHKAAAEGKKAAIIDLDTVNPYFRTNDVRKRLEQEGIRVIASEFANSNLDMPTVPAETASVFYEPETVAVFDVGGDEDGAFALGQYKQFFESRPYQMFMVVNTKRPLTAGAEDLAEMKRVIEAASRLRFTGIANNTNLAKETGADTLLSDYGAVLELSKKTGIPIAMQCGLPAVIERLPADIAGERFPMEIFIQMPWEV